MKIELNFIQVDALLDLLESLKSQEVVRVDRDLFEESLEEILQIILKQKEEEKK